MIACRFCDAPLTTQIVDLGLSPLANSYRGAEELERPEPRYPLRLFVCDACLLVQLGDPPDPGEMFSSYAYVPSFSTTWLEHADRYAESVCERFGIGPSQRVVEVASNDGSLLRGFVNRGVPVLGVEPAENLARQASETGVPTRAAFFDDRLAAELKDEGLGADLLIANNVLAHVPTTNDFVRGFKTLLNPGGVATLEFPHLLRIVEEVQFDTIYHEHVFYFSLAAVDRLFNAHGLHVVDVDELSLQGGSLRVYVRHADDEAPRSARVDAVLAEEGARGLDSLDVYRAFGESVEGRRLEVREFFAEARARGASIGAYGAPAKATTLVNSCELDVETIPYTVDRNPLKQGRFIPGTRIPIESPDRIRETRPDLVFVFAWNLVDEIADQLSFVREWGGRFVVHVPRVEVRA